MKKTIEREIKVCDHCGNEDSVFYSCLHCGKDLCWECWKTQGEVYNHAVHFQGTCDGRYCLSCDAELRKLKNDKLHNAFVIIRQLRNEEASWYRDFKTRSERAEKNLRVLQGK